MLLSMMRIKKEEKMAMEEDTTLTVASQDINTYMIRAMNIECGASSCSLWGGEG